MDVADIWNQALGLVGSDTEIQDPDEENTAPARACRRYWETVRSEVLRDFPWPKLKVVADLTVLESEPNNGTYWQYRYAMPTNCARILRILNGGARQDTETSRIPYDVGTNATDGTQFIDCDLEDAQIEYTFNQTTIARWDADMVSVAAHLLATRIAAHFGPDAVKLGDRAMKHYVWRLNVALANAANEVQPDLPPAGGSFVAARE